MPTRTPLEIVSADGSDELRLIGEVDLATAPKLADALEKAAGNGSGVTLDLAELDFIDSSGLVVLVQHSRSMNGRGPLRLINVPAHVIRLLEITNLDDQFEITPRHG